MASDKEAAVLFFIETEQTPGAKTEALTVYLSASYPATVNDNTSDPSLLMVELLNRKTTVAPAASALLLVVM